MTGAVAFVAAGSKFSVTVTPELVSGFGTQTGIATARVTGGVAPVTVLWSVEGDPLEPATPTLLTTRFEGTPPSAETFAVSALCTATDANGRVAVSNTINAQVTGL